MADYPYSTKLSSLKAFLAYIQNEGEPNKVSQAFLPSIGFKSSNDRKLTPIFRFLGFIGSDGVPTQIWRAYRDKKKAPKVLADAIRTAYSDLFSIYPDAHRKDKEALRNYFASKTKVGARALDAIVGTFTELCAKADFDSGSKDFSDPVREQTDSDIAIPTSESVPSVTTTAQTSSGVTININIEIAVPDSDKADTYDKFFAALNKHVLKK